MSHTLRRGLLTVPACLLAFTGCSGDDSTDRAETSVSLERDEDAFLATLAGPPEAAGLTEDEVIARGDEACDLARSYWVDFGVGADNELFLSVITRDADDQVAALAPHALDHLCPELDHRNVPDGQVPDGIVLDPAARHPDSGDDETPRFDFNALITLPRDTPWRQRGAVSECKARGLDVVEGAPARLYPPDDAAAPSVGDISMVYDIGTACEFFVSVLDAPAYAKGTYELSILGLDSYEFSAADAIETELEPVELTVTD